MSLDPLTIRLSEPATLQAWLVLTGLALTWLIIDLWRNNRQIRGLMRWVWYLTVLYSGPLGLAGYYFSGRRQIARDSISRRGFRSVAHCYSGCGLGELTGIILTAGILGLQGWWVATITFLFAYTFGFALTAGPLIQEGIPVRRSLLDALYSESASITVMEVVAIGVDRMLAGNAGITEPLFWTSMMLSLSAGLVAAYPVNILLIHFGVKEGMHDPRHMG